MIIVHDALVFEQLGKLIYQEGWIEFFKNGPNREPVYPLLVSISMHAQDIFPISYQTFQKLIQFAFLFITQILCLRMLKELKINPSISALTILYIGISPALVNSTLSLFSEVAAYPFVVGIILCATKAWKAVAQDSIKTSGLIGLTLGILFLLIIFVKAIFIYIVPFFLFPFVCLGLYFMRKKDKNSLFNVLTFLLTVLFVIYGSSLTYKSINRHYNDHFAITDRGAWMLYASIKKRSEPLTARRFQAFLAQIPDEEVCQSIFENEDCGYWSHEIDSDIGRNKRRELLHNGIPANQIDGQLIALALGKFISNPLLHFSLCFLEGFKMLFWESTRIGFVAYPDWLENLYKFDPFKQGLRYFIFFMTFCSMIYLIKYCFRNKNLLRDFSTVSDRYIMCFFILILCLSFIYLNSLVVILTRFSFPIVPLYLVAIALFLQRIVSVFNKED